MSSVHAYRARCSWSGSTGEGYEQYRREHVGSAPPAGDSLLLSADPAFRGQAEHLNPEQLVALAAASCQLLSFLSVAARARLDVVAYEDDAEGVMPEGDSCSADPDRAAAADRFRCGTYGAAGASPGGRRAPRVLHRQLAAHRHRRAGADRVLRVGTCPLRRSFLGGLKYGGTMKLRPTWSLASATLRRATSRGNV